MSWCSWQTLGSSWTLFILSQATTNLLGNCCWLYFPNTPTRQSLLSTSTATTGLSPFMSLFFLAVSYQVCLLAAPLQSALRPGHRVPTSDQARASLSSAHHAAKPSCFILRNQDLAIPYWTPLFPLTPPPLTSPVYFSFSHSLVEHSGTFQSQGLCTRCYLCPNAFSSVPHGSPHLLQVFTYSTFSVRPSKATPAKIVITCLSHSRPLHALCSLTSLISI